MFDMKDSWKNYDEDALMAAVNYFAEFLEKPDKEILREWVMTHVPATEVFTGDMDDGDFLDNEALLDPFPEFAEAFSPHSERWDLFCITCEDMSGVWLQEWDTFDPKVLQEVVELFALFVKEPHAEIEDWVRDNINPSWALEFAQDYESQVDVIYSIMGEAPFLAFHEKFAPGTKEWTWCCGLLIDMGAEDIEEIDSYEA